MLNRGVGLAAGTLASLAVSAGSPIRLMLYFHRAFRAAGVHFWTTEIYHIIAEFISADDGSNG